MFKVLADSLEAYFDFDLKRKADLLSMDELIRNTVPGLTRWFYNGASAKGAGMKMNLIGYGKFQYTTKPGNAVDWPVIGMALQKNYISLYLSAYKNGRPVVDEYKGKMGELKTGNNNFSFTTFDQLNIKEISRLFADIVTAVNDNGKDGLHYNRVSF